jgi:hypothetical protein
MSVLTRADAVLAARKTLEIDETEDEVSCEREQVEGRSASTS